jgi:transcriptional regulator with XRE-family HTH domain
MSRVSSQIREIIKADGWTIGEISRGTGIAKERISRFLNGLRGLDHVAFDALLTFLGLVVVRGPDYRKRGRKGRSIGGLTALNRTEGQANDAETTRKRRGRDSSKS